MELETGVQSHCTVHVTPLYGCAERTVENKI